MAKSPPRPTLCVLHADVTTTSSVQQRLQATRLSTYMEEYLIPMNDCFSDVFINSLGNRLSFN